MNGGPSGAPAPREERPLTERLREAVEEAVPGLRLVPAGGQYVITTGPPKYREIDSRPCQVVIGWRNPESTMAHVARRAVRMARQKGITL